MSRIFFGHPPTEVVHSGSGAATLPLPTADSIGLNLPLNPPARQSLRYRWIETGGVYRKQWHPVAVHSVYQVTAQAAAHEGSGAATLPLATASGAGKKERAGTGSATLPLPTAAGTGKRDLKASGASTLPLVTASGSGSSAEDIYSGSGAAVIPLLTASGAGKKERKGSGSSTLPILTASGTAKRELKGSGAVILPFVTASGSGKKTRSGEGATTLPVLTAAGTAQRGLKGSGATVLPFVTASGDGQLEGTHSGSGDGALPILSAEGEGNVVRLVTDQPSGGYAAENYAAIERARRRRLKALADEDEADRLEALLIAEGQLPPNPVIDDRIVVREYAVQAEAFNRRTQRAIDYALRARTDLAYQLAAREIANALEDENFAVLLLIAAAA